MSIAPTGTAVCAMVLATLASGARALRTSGEHAQYGRRHRLAGEEPACPSARDQFHHSHALTPNSANSAIAVPSTIVGILLASRVLHVFPVIRCSLVPLVDGNGIQACGG
jgi:hypothetical protein